MATPLQLAFGALRLAYPNFVPGWSTLARQPSVNIDSPLFRRRNQGVRLQGGADRRDKNPGPSPKR